MWEWSEKLKLGKSSAFVKRDIRALPQTEAEFEADFFLDPKLSTEDEQAWTGSGDRAGTRLHACLRGCGISTAHGQ